MTQARNISLATPVTAVLKFWLSLVQVSTEDSLHEGFSHPRIAFRIVHAPKTLLSYFSYLGMKHSYDITSYARIKNPSRCNDADGGLLIVLSESAKPSSRRPKKTHHSRHNAAYP